MKRDADEVVYSNVDAKVADPTKYVWKYTLINENNVCRSYADFSGIIPISGLVLVVPRAMRSVLIKRVTVRIIIIAFAPGRFGLGAETCQWMRAANQQFNVETEGRMGLLPEGIEGREYIER
jgi:hypothetical protein